MADSKKEEGRDDDDLLFDYTNSKKEEAGHGDEEEGHDDDDRPFDCTDSKKEEAEHGDKEEGHDDDDDHPYDYTDSKKEEGHDDDDERPFDYNLQVLAQIAEAFLRKDYPKGYAGAGEERSPLQRPQDCSHGVVKKKPRSFQEKLSINKKRRVSPPASPLTAASTSDVDKLVKTSSSSRGKAKLQQSASTSTRTTDSDDDPCWNTQLLRRWGLSKSRSRRIYSNSGEGTSTDRRLQRDLAAGADRAADHQPPPPPAAPQAGRTWREVHLEMGGGEVVRIGKKTVHGSDTSTHQSRLLLPHGLEAQVYEHVLPRERKKINAAGLQVEVLDYYGQRFEMKCKYRGSQKGMVFNFGWTDFLKGHEGRHLRKGESLLLLAFRSQQQRLCFVFIPQHLQEQEEHQHDNQDQVIQH